MARSSDSISVNNINLLLAYLTDEIQAAKTKEDLTNVFYLVQDMFSPSALQNTVQGLLHIRAEVDREAIIRANGNNDCTIQLAVPPSLRQTFKDLSQRMCHLQETNTETFHNASKALRWMADGELPPSN